MAQYLSPTRALIFVVSVVFFLIVFAPAIILVAALGYSYVSAKYYSHFGKAFPSNHVYQALLVANKKRLTPQEGAGNANDVTEELRQITAGETFIELIADFGQLGNSTVYDAQKKAVSKFVPGQEYLLELNSYQLSVLRIPDSTFDKPFDFFTFSVKIKYDSDSQYIVLEAKSHDEVTPL